MMSQHKIKLFVSCHKPTRIPEGDCFVPLHVGRSKSVCKEEMKDYIGDDTGDNISDRNPYYCEATGIYWIWKNVHDVEYVGLNHYRRQFDYNFTNQNVDALFKDGTDVILAERILQPHDRWHGALNYIQVEDLLILRGVIRKLYPEYLISLNRYFRDYKSNAYNMVICRKCLYDEYAEWLFKICFEMQNYIRFSGYSNKKRVFGYITELLTPLYFYHNNFKIKEVPIVFDGKPAKVSFNSKVLYFILKNTLWKILRDKPVFVDPSTYRGLEQDGIDLNYY